MFVFDKKFYDFGDEIFKNPLLEREYFLRIKVANAFGSFLPFLMVAIVSMVYVPFFRLFIFSMSGLFLLNFVSFILSSYAFFLCRNDRLAKKNDEERTMRYKVLDSKIEKYDTIKRFGHFFFLSFATICLFVFPPFIETTLKTTFNTNYTLYVLNFFILCFFSFLYGVFYILDDLKRVERYVNRIFLKFKRAKNIKNIRSIRSIAKKIKEAEAKSKGLSE